MSGGTRIGVVAALLWLGGLFAGGCSTFPRDFARAASAPAKSADPISIAGPWQGQWKSNGGHGGRLRCLLTRAADGGEGDLAFDARFEAKFWGIFTAHYTVTLKGRGDESPGTVKLRGDHDLGSLAGGVFHYEASVTARRFDATYRSSEDAGEFHMMRPAK
jgi:hypothetical protein